MTKNAELNAGAAHFLVTFSRGMHQWAATDSCRQLKCVQSPLYVPSTMQKHRLICMKAGLDTSSYVQLNCSVFQTR